MKMNYCAALLLAVPTILSAQPDTSQAGPRVGPPIQRITTASSVSTERIGAVMGVRELPDGRILVNDGLRRRLLVMDTALQVQRVVLDSVSDIMDSYGTRPGALLPFRGDTTLFVDPASYAMLVIDPQGNVTRVRSVWRVQDVPYFASTNSFYGVPGVDAKGRIVYRQRAIPAPPAVPPPDGVPYFPPDPDSAFIVAVDIDTRKLDTLGVIRVPKQVTTVRRSPEGFWSFDMATNPLPVTDDWAVLSDGGVAFVRALDYRIDYLNPDGSWSSSAKLPFEWTPLSDADKERIVDSVKVAQHRSNANSHVTQLIRWVNMYARDYPRDYVAPEGYVLPPGLPKDWLLPKGVTFPENYVYACPPGTEPPAQTMTMTAGNPADAARQAMQRGNAASGAPAQPACMPAPISFSTGTVPPMPQPRQSSVVPPQDLPDYRPPLPTNAVRADMDGNLWIRTQPPKPVPGGAVFDIVNRQGELVNRIQLPPGYTIVGFGRDRVVYATMRDQSGIKLARIRLK